MTVSTPADTSEAARRGGFRMIKWGGGLLAALAVAHTMLALIGTVPQHADAWFSAELWGTASDELSTMTPANGAFWVSIGSWGIPQFLIGLTILWLARRAIVPPAFIAWTVLAMSLIGGVIYEPAPWFVDWIAVGLLLFGARRVQRAATRPGDA